MMNICSPNGGLDMAGVRRYFERIQGMAERLPETIPPNGPQGTWRTSFLGAQLEPVAKTLEPGQRTIPKEQMLAGIADAYDATKTANKDTFFKRLHGRTTAELDPAEIREAIENPAAEAMLSAYVFSNVMELDGLGYSDQVLRAALRWGADVNRSMMDSYLLVRGLADRDLTPSQADILAKGALNNYAYFPSGGGTDNTLGFRVLCALTSKASIDTLLNVIDSYPRGYKVKDAEAQRKELLRQTIGRPDITGKQLDQADMQLAGSQALQIEKNRMINQRRIELGVEPKPITSLLFTR